MMNEKDFAFLQELVETPSPSGFEQPAQRLIRRELADVADEIRTDVMGNVICRLDGQGEGRPRVMLAGHCDEIGFMITHIDERGFLFFAPIGGIDAHLVPGQRVHVQGATGPILGVVGKKPIHMMDAQAREKVVPLKEQFIDIGCQDLEEAKALVAIGDPVTFAVGLERLQGDRAISRAFDDKMGAFIVTRVAQEIKRRGAAPVDLFAVSTVQEEVGLRGGTTSSYGVNPDVGIAVDVGFATDFPGMDPKEIGSFEVGKGPIVARGANINPVLFELLMQTAEEEQIPVQVMAAPRGTGTDANAMQLTRDGVVTALVKVPLRYMHTPVEMLSLADLEATVRLLTGLLYRIECRDVFIPN